MANWWEKPRKKDTLEKDNAAITQPPRMMPQLQQGAPLPAPAPIGTTAKSPSSPQLQPPPAPPPQGKQVQPLNNPPPQGGGPGSFGPPPGGLAPPNQIGKPAARPMLSPAQQAAIDAIQRGPQAPNQGVSAPAAGAQAGNGPANPQSGPWTPTLQQTLTPATAPALTGNDAFNAALNSLLNTDLRDTTAEKEAAARIAAEREAAAVQAQRARAGFGGFGLSGASSAQEGDIRRQAASQLSTDMLGIDKAARDEQLQRITVGVQAGLANSSNEIQREAWKQWMLGQEVEYGTDIDGDGKIGYDEADKFKEENPEEDPLLTLSTESAGTTLTSTNRKRLQDQGLNFRAVVGQPYYVDQFGNQYPMTADDPRHPDNIGWGV